MMFKKGLALFVGGKLANYARFFGFMALALAAIIGMAWAHCRSDSKKQKCHASGAASDAHAAEKGVDK